MCLPALRTAPQRCPLNNGNLLDVVLFVENEEQCKQKCRTEEKCIFYFFYEGISFIVYNPKQISLENKCLKITLFQWIFFSNKAGPTEAVRERLRLARLEDDDVQDGFGEINNLEAQPSQCFLFDKCSRDVLEATVDCPLTKYFIPHNCQRLLIFHYFDIMKIKLTLYF